MKRILVIAFVLAFVAGSFSVNAVNTGQQVDYPLLAGQTTPVGMIHVFDNGTNLSVQYEITQPGWFLVATHLYVGATAPKSGAPGQFSYHHTSLHATLDAYDVPIVVGTRYYVAAHAIVSNEQNIIGSDCSVTQDDLNATFPDTGTVLVTHVYPIQTSFDLVVSTSSGVLNGTYSGWCADASHGISFLTSYPATFYSDFGTLPASAIDKPENLDLVNWIINQEFPYPYTIVQNAIWYLLENDTNPPYCDPTYCMDIVNQALGHDGFVPNFAMGDATVIIVLPKIGDTVYQTLLLEFTPECTPIYQEDTAWASAGGSAIPFKTGWGSYFVYIP